MTTLNFDLDFATNNQSIWNNGDASSIEHNKFLGGDWQKKFDKSFLGDVVGVEGETNGKVGLQSNFKLDAGSVNASLPVDLWLDIPSEVKPGETITISSGFSLDNTASFSTISPKASYDLDVIFDVDGKLKGKAFSKSKTIFSFDENYTKNLLSIDSDDIDYSISESQLKGFGSFDLHVPKVDTTGSINGSNTLSAQGSDKFLNASLDLDKVATTLLNTVGVPIPPLEGSASTKIDIPFAPDIKLSAGYNILDVELASDLSLNQKFDLKVEDVTGELVLENGEKINFEVGQDVTFTVPEGIGSSLEIDAFVDLDADFSNQTSLDYNGDVDIEGLSANVKIAGIGGSVGPVFDKNYDLFDGDVNLYNKTFDLGGLNTESFSFDIAATAELTPIIGGPGNDDLRGDTGSNDLRGGDGDDYIFGDDGTDTLNGEAGNDFLVGWNGSDTMYGEVGNDTLWAGNGDDQAYGGDGDDQLAGWNGNDYLDGGNGNDELIGDKGDDELIAGNGNDTLTGSMPSELDSGFEEFDILTGGDGADTFVLGNSVEAFYNNDSFGGYAEITDFNWAEGDKFQVFGSLDDYTVSEFGGGMDIYYQNDLIAWVSNTTNVIPSEDFTFA